MLKILVLGSNGMAGHIIVNYLNSLNKYTIRTSARSNSDYNLDIETDLDLLLNAIVDFKPDIIINCIGLLIKACNDNPDKAIYINSYFPHWLEKITNNINTKIIHLSTDCVFSGDKGNYKDTDIKDGIGFYAQSKALGEIINNKDLTIRISIIGSELRKGGSGLFEWFMKQKGVIRGYSECFWSGITTLELAKAIDKLIISDITGLYQLSPNYKISKYDLLNLIKEIWNKTDVIILKDSTVKHNKSLINSDKGIPNYTIPNNYKVMLLEMKEFMEKL